MPDNQTLIAEESPVKFGGRARINRKHLLDIGINDGSQVVLSSKTKDILVDIFSDELVEEGKIIIRGEDMKKLGINESGSVQIQAHSKLLKPKALDNLL